MANEDVQARNSHGAQRLAGAAACTDRYRHHQLRPITSGHVHWGCVCDVMARHLPWSLRWSSFGHARRRRAP